jgi:hypothetical protein
MSIVFVGRAYMSSGAVSCVAQLPQKDELSGFSE